MSHSVNGILLASPNGMCPLKKLATESDVPQWHAPTRIAVFTMGLISLVLSARARGVTRKALGLFGLSSLVRAATNRRVTDVIGWIANPAIRLRRTVGIEASVDDVYDFLSKFSNYPRFMSYVEKVEVGEGGALRWVVRGPGRVNFHLTTVVKKMTRNQSISWKSLSNSLIRNSGDLQLVELPGKRTQVRVELMYSPPVGALGFDPKEKIDQDLQVLKELIEKESNLLSAAP
jgi:uncharacterized membrane protein